jgi:excisionase family DNA binding protein
MTAHSTPEVRAESSLFEIRIDHKWLTSKEVAAFLSISPNAVRIMVYRGQIPTFKLGRRLRFRFKDCESLLHKKGS